MPVQFQLFDLTMWVDYTDRPEDAERLARERWNEARQAWGRENGWTPLDVLRHGLNARRVADGLPPIDYEGQGRRSTGTHPLRAGTDADPPGEPLSDPTSEDRRRSLLTPSQDKHLGKGEK